MTIRVRPDICIQEELSPNKKGKETHIQRRESEKAYDLLETIRVVSEAERKWHQIKL